MHFNIKAIFLACFYEKQLALNVRHTYIYRGTVALLLALL